jgi:two-component system, NarL family, response regulator DevR
VSDRPVRVFLVDDHEVVVQGLRQVLSAAPGLEVVGQAGTAHQAVQEIIAEVPDVAVIDVRLPDGNGVDVAREVRSAAPTVRCVMFTAFSAEDALLRSVIAGAAGYLNKDADRATVIDTIRRAAAGESLIDPSQLANLRETEVGRPDFGGLLSRLSPHEQRILRLVVEGQTNREIANQMRLAEKTIRNYVSNILGKVGLRNRTQLAVYVAHLLDDRQA